MAIHDPEGSRVVRFCQTNVQLLRKRSTAKPSVDVASRIRQMLQGIMKYRTTRDTLCWYLRSWSAGGDEG